MDTWRIELPELGLVGETSASQSAPHALAPRVTRGDQEQPTIRSRVVLGGPDLAQMLPRSQDDPNLADRRGNNDFWSALMTLTIDPVEPETVVSAWLGVELASDDGNPPVAFAMLPSYEGADVQVEQDFSAEATLKVLKIGGGEKQTHTARIDEVRALNRLRSDPAWELTPSPGRALHPTDFVLVIKSAHGSAGRGTVTFGAELAWRTGIFRKHEVSFSGDPITFSFSAKPQG